MIQVFCFGKATYRLNVYRGNPQYEYHFRVSKSCSGIRPKNAQTLLKLNVKSCSKQKQNRKHFVVLFFCLVWCKNKNSKDFMRNFAG